MTQCLTAQKQYTIDDLCYGCFFRGSCAIDPKDCVKERVVSSTVFVMVLEYYIVNVMERIRTMEDNKPFLIVEVVKNNRRILVLDDNQPICTSLIVDYLREKKFGSKWFKDDYANYWNLSFEKEFWAFFTEIGVNWYTWDPPEDYKKIDPAEVEELLKPMEVGGYKVNLVKRKSDGKVAFAINDRVYEWDDKLDPWHLGKACTFLTDIKGKGIFTPLFKAFQQFTKECPEEYKQYFADWGKSEEDLWRNIRQEEITNGKFILYQSKSEPDILKYVVEITNPPNRYESDPFCVDHKEKIILGFTEIAEKLGVAKIGKFTGDFEKFLCKNIGYVKKTLPVKAKTKEDEFEDLTPYLMTPPLTNEEMEKYRPLAEEWLKKPDLIRFIRETLDRRITGEICNKLGVFFAAHTPKFGEFNPKNVLNTLGQAPSAAGKSHIDINALRLHHNVLDFTGITQQALHWAKADFRGYNIFIRELSGAQSATPSLRMAMSEGGLRLFVPLKDEKGNMKSKVIESVGTPAIHSTTTAVDIDEQIENRTLFISPDESKEQTAKIMENKAEYYKTITNPKFTEEEMIVRCINQLLEPIRVMIPYASKIAEVFPKEPLRVRADFDKFCSLTMSIASYYREQRFKIKNSETGETLVFANLKDLKCALTIGSEIFGATIQKISPSLAKFYNTLVNAIPKGTYFTLEDAMKATGKARETCRPYLKKLSQAGRLNAKQENKHWIYSIGTEVIKLKEFSEMLENLTFTKEEFREYLIKYCKYTPKDEELGAWYVIWQTG